jgi:poly(hydroxyalkanoate) depolymerase family esterase
MPPRCLVMMLHGCGQDAAGFARLTGIEEAASQGLVVVSPEQSRRKNVPGCWNWFQPEHRARGLGEAEILAALARETAAAHLVPPGGIFVAGFSAGGAMALALRDAYPDLFAAVCVHSGVDPSGVRDGEGAAAAMRGEFRQGLAWAERRHVPTLVIHGTADTVVNSTNAWRIAAGQGGSGRPRPGDRLMLVEGGGHTWFGGAPDLLHGDPLGPDATGAALAFFLDAAPADGLRGRPRRSVRGVRAWAGRLLAS